MINLNNYDVGIIFGDWKTHEGVLNTTRASLRSVGEYPFSDKFFWLTPIGFVPTRIYPNFSLRKNFAKLNIIGNFKNPLVSREQL
jgi:hypothetical protein